MTSNLEKLYNNLNLVDKKEFVRLDELNTNSLNNVSLRYKNALEEMKPEAMFCMENEPLILFFNLEFEHNNENKIKNIQKQTWNFDKAPIIVISTSSEIVFYNAFDFDIENDKLSILTKSTKDFENFSYENLYTGKIFSKYRSKFNDKKRVNTLLFQHIINYRQALMQKGMNPSFATKLLSRIIFLKYLKDRKISVNKSNSKMIEDSFKNKKSLYKLFNYLKKEFNGDLFDIDEKENSLLSDEYMDIVRGFFYDSDINGQLRLFIPFDFSIIPIELVSSIYEYFLNYKQYENKSYYTPAFLVDYIINTTVTPFLNNKKNSNCKILDPACGSGIFLIEALRKIINKEEQITQTKITSKRLKELVSNNIFGIDKDEDAINIAIFSLYITLLDYQNPRSILNFRFPHLKDNNFFVSDFFDETNCFNDKINNLDFILSNPPYGDIKEGMHNSWYKKNNIPVNDNQIAESFMAKVKDFCHNQTVVSMVITSKIFYNIKAQNYRKFFLKNCSIKQILELSPVRKQIFSGAVPPVAIITYTCPESVSIDNNIVYTSIKPNLHFKYFKILLIEKNDIKHIKQNLFLKYDWLWKVILYGNILDFYFIKRLLDDYDFLNKQKEQLICGEGIQLGGSCKMSAELLNGKPYLDTKKKQLKPFCIEENELKPFYANSLHRNKANKMELFKAPMVLIKKGNSSDLSCVSAVAVKDMVYTDSVSSIKFKDYNEDKVFNLCGLFNSQFFTYYILNTSSSAAVERNQIHISEYLKIPYQFDEGLANYVKQVHALCSEDNTHFLINILDKNHNLSKDKLLKLINDKIKQMYNISETEEDLIDYATNISIPIWRFGDNISNFKEPIAYKAVSKIQLTQYADIFIEAFGEQYKNFSVDIYTFKYCTLMNFNARDKFAKKSQITFEENKDVENIIKTISDFSITDITNEIYIKKDIKGFNENSFFVIKTNEYKNWHRAIARLDVNEFLNAIWEAELELSE